MHVQFKIDNREAFLNKNASRRRDPEVQSLLTINNQTYLATLSPLKNLAMS